jgi:predicted short-subunit dehydrogenase-like oxidoreductase (DUF2520 family)
VKPKLGFIGAGRVGQALASVAYDSGYKIVVVSSATSLHAPTLANRVHAAYVENVDLVAQKSDLVFLTVPDDAIQTVATSFSEYDWTNKAVVHTSGAHDARLLVALKLRGAKTGSLHPIYPFAHLETSIRELHGATFALEAEDQLLQKWLIDLVDAIGGDVIHIPAGMKPLYHSALVLASNYLVTLYSIAERILLDIGADLEIADNVLIKLMKATLQNLETVSASQALTGPIVRGDLATMQGHLSALKNDKEIGQLYRQLAELTYPLLRSRGLSDEYLEQLDKLFRRDVNNANDNPRPSKDEGQS